MKKVLFIGGSLNQTKIAHAVANQLKGDYDCYFTPYYADGWIDWLVRQGWLNFTVLGGNPRRQTEAYLAENNLQVDYQGAHHDYDLVVTTSDLLIQKNIRRKKIILVQEGMTDPEGFRYHLVKWLGLPRFVASTATNGLSNAYQYFCVASEGYKEHFIRKGVKAKKLVVTGIPNFDNVARFLDNDFPHKNFVLVATSDARETFRRDNRTQFIRRALEIAAGRQLIFKLHPNEWTERATKEIKAIAPDALVYTKGSIEPMIANCDVLITQYSTVVYVGLALGKEVHSYFNVEKLRRMTPVQNGGTSGQNIAQICRDVLEEKPVRLKRRPTYAYA